MTDADKDLRYELKMPFDARRLYQVRAWVNTHPAGFRMSYPPRQVNNIYFDLPGMPLFLDHLNGSESRYKLRFRWYGREVTGIQGVLEVKHKKGNLGWKEHRTITHSLDLAKMSWADVIQALSQENSDWVAEMLHSAQVVMLNHYQREYFVSGDGQTRLTLDYDLVTFHQQFHSSPNLRFREPQGRVMLIEIKTGMEKPSEVAELLAGFPLRIEQYSKYVGMVDGLTGRLRG